MNHDFMFMPAVHGKFAFSLSGYSAYIVLAIGNCVWLKSRPSLYYIKLVMIRIVFCMDYFLGLWHLSGIRGENVDFLLENENLNFDSKLIVCTCDILALFFTLIRPSMALSFAGSRTHKEFCKLRCSLEMSITLELSTQT